MFQDDEAVFRLLLMEKRNFNFSFANQKTAPKNIAVLLLLAFLLMGCMKPLLAADDILWINQAPVLFKDDFSKYTGGWMTYQDSPSFAGYEQNGFRLMTVVPDYQIWSVPGLNFRNTQVFVQATKLDGTNDNLFGLLCRYQDESHYYAFVISSDGYFGIYKQVEGQLALIDQAHMDFSPVINQGATGNDIQAVCLNDQLVLTVNDTKLLQVQDNTFSHGDVGVVAGCYAKPGVNILFDNFIVLQR